ncbi:MAG: nicotinate (nicotinamide) nucleotide adenylyltransferase [Sandaracinaceae bacterium]
MTGPTWAVFGGSFDPPHMGHVMGATWVASTQGVDRVLVVPAFQHAFDKRLTPFAHRRRMAELAFSRLRGVTVTDLEARLGGASYTVRTLEYLKQSHPGVALRLMIGTDLVDQVPQWREGPRIPELAALLVVGRGGYADEGGEHESVVMPEVSSTEVRRRLGAGESVAHMVPREVAAYAVRHGLYTS